MTLSTQSMVEVRTHERLVELVLNRPRAHNALSTEMAQQLIRACETAVRERARAVVLTSAGEKAFCVGADLKERNGFTDDDLMRQRIVFRKAFQAVLELPMPAVAAVHGYALGGGFEIALSCDLMVADESAVFGLPEVRVGLVPGGGGTQLLSRRIGSTRASDLIFTGRRIDIEEAERWGVVERRCVAGQVREQALELAAAIAENSPTAVANAKHALTTGKHLPLPAAMDVEDAAWRATALSDDRREGIAAFNAKRSPNWKD
ncbi:enoyl-CoA hydratase-related protein [Prauserella halophila]|uniref:Enoyl-CoA hydratase-related protein n=1 Tax=Prauserella halophila TaxID=185641 RepID=A0ABN1WGN7_9PSEU|nr:enoyl-CoA hydratase-related protein [Prauserella halophila]MCP2238229.1 Enoyl-CoA hydratase/carnithine racemase [Prauserella halophila]